MGKMKQYWLLTGVVIVALLIAGYFLGVKPQAAKAEAVKAQTAGEVMVNTKRRGEIKILQNQAAGVMAQQARLRQIAAILPNNPSLPRLVRSLSALTEATGVDLSSMAPGPMSAVAIEASPAAAPAAARTETDGSAAPVRRTPAAASSGVSQMPVTLAMTGDFYELQLFLSKIEKLDRIFVVDTLAVSPGGVLADAAGKKRANTLNMSIVGRVFVKSAAPVAVPPAAARAAAATQK